MVRVKVKICDNFQKFHELFLFYKKKFFIKKKKLAWIMLSDWAIKQLEKITYDYLQLNCQEGTCYGVFAVSIIIISNLYILLIYL